MEKFITVTIRPQEKMDGSGWKYRVMVDTLYPSPWVQHGWYNSPKEVLEAFSPPLSALYEQAVRDHLAEHKEICFSLENAY